MRGQFPIEREPHLVGKVLDVVGSVQCGFGCGIQGRCHKYPAHMRIHALPAQLADESQKLPDGIAIRGSAFNFNGNDVAAAATAQEVDPTEGDLRLALNDLSAMPQHEVDVLRQKVVNLALDVGFEFAGHRAVLCTCSMTVSLSVGLCLCQYHTPK
jgi:hypothetical protein